MKARLLRVIDVANTLGESILWDERRSVLLWTDIESRTLYEYCPGSNELRRISTPARVASFGLTTEDTVLIVAFDRGIARFDIVTGKTEWLTDSALLPAGIRMNDGRVDHAGCFCIGTKTGNPADTSVTGKLYRYSPTKGLQTILAGIRVSNALCFDPGGTAMYHCDSPTREIRVYSYDPRSGKASGGRPFAQASAPAYPDGSTVDADGYVWNAQWGGARVVRHAADGSVDGYVELPVSQPTCVALGGKDFSLLCVTSARDGLSPRRLGDEPQAGNVFIFQTDITGLPEQRCRL